MGLRGRIKRLVRQTERDMITFRLEDGTTSRFYADEFMDCFTHEFERGSRHYFGEEPGPAHPMVEALRKAAPGEVERLMSTQGTMLGLLVGEDEIIRGERERPGPPVKWDAGGKVCE